MTVPIQNSLQLKTSRYVQGGQTETKNKKIEWWEREVYESSDSDRVYTVENFYEGRLDMISYVFYDEPRFWWFIAQYNNILDPFSEIIAGRILRIPTKDRLMLLMRGKTGGVDSTRSQIPSIPPVIV